MTEYYYASITESKIEIPFIEKFEISKKRIYISNILNKGNEEIIGISNNIGELQDFIFPIEGFIPLVTENLAEDLSKIEKNITVIPVLINHHEKIYKYSLIKINTIYNCIDWTQTRFLVVNDNIKCAMGNIYINISNINSEIFHINGWDAYPIFSNRIINELNKYRIDGISFTKISAA
jgi:hypothetical protein